MFDIQLCGYLASAHRGKPGLAYFTGFSDMWFVKSVPIYEINEI